MGYFGNMFLSEGEQQGVIRKLESEYGRTKISEQVFIKVFQK